MGNGKGKFRLWGIINPADVLIAAALIALVWGLLVFSAPQRVSANPGDGVIRYTVMLLEPKETGFHERITTGTALFDNLKGYWIGTVVDVYADTFRMGVGDEAAEVVRLAAVEGLEHVYIVVEAPASIGASSTDIGAYSVMVNKEVYMRSKDFASQGLVTSMEGKE